MDLYLIASDKTGIPYVLSQIFPGAKLEPWLPNAKPLNGKVGEAVQYIATYFHDHNDGHGAQPLSFTQVREAIGVKCRQNFNQNIRKHPDFQDALIKMNVSEFSLNNSKRLTHFRLQ